MKIIVEDDGGARVEIARASVEQVHAVHEMLAGYFKKRHRQAAASLLDKYPPGSTADDALAERAIAAMQDFTPGNQPAPAAPKKITRKKKK